MRKAAAERLTRIIGWDAGKLRTNAHAALEDFATVLSLVPDISRWLSED